MESRKNVSVILLLCTLTVLAGCATPKVHLNTGNMAMEVNSKVPAVGSVAYSPDGKSVVSAGWDPIAKHWDLAGARELKKLGTTRSGFAEALAFSPDGKTIAVSITGMTNFSENKVTLWDAQTGKMLREITGIGGRMVSFSPDGRTVLGGTGGFKAGTVKLADTQTGSIIKTFDAFWGSLSPDGRYLLNLKSKDLMLIDRETGGTVWKTPIGSVGAYAFSPDGRLIIVACNEKSGIGSLNTSLKLLDAATGNQIRAFGHKSVPGGLFSVESVFHTLGAVQFTPDGRYVMTGDLGGRYQLWDVANGTAVRQMNLVNELSGTMLNIAPSLAFSPNGRTAVVASLASTRLFDITTGDEVATMIAFEDGEWLFITPSGYYNSSEKGDQYLSIKLGDQPYPIAQFRESFFRPDLVKVAIFGGSLKDYRKIAEVKKPPVVAIVDTPSSVSGSDITVTLKISDMGGGIGDVRLYLNGSAVMLESRGIEVKPVIDASAVYKKFTVKLGSGLNTIRAIAFNGDNTMQSADSVQQITSSYADAAKPTLHALVIGINEYKNPKLQLNHAAADAALFANTLTKVSAPLFSRVVVKKLSTGAETTQENILKELQAFRSLNPDDLFVFYVASHGTVDDGEYFMITSNVGSTSTKRLKTDAISQNTLKQIIANIPATKKLIVIDTCSAGKLGDEIQTAMLTRGMSEDTAMKMLSRAVGSTILSASTSVQEALEGYNGHGLFTYVLAEGLGGKADKGRSGFVKTTELADYVDSEVPILAEKVFKRAQYPTVSISGMGFPIGRVDIR